MHIGIPADQFRRYVIQPTLNVLGDVEAKWKSPAIEELLLGTAIMESRLRYLEQIGGGPGLGFFQVEPRTARWLWNVYLPERQPDMKAALELLARNTAVLNDKGLLEELIISPTFACGMARALYWSVPEKLPEANDIKELANYWDLFYNRNPDKGFPADWENLYRTVVQHRD